MPEQHTTDSPNTAIALLFSGGLDTTLEAVERLAQYGAAHLVTFDNGCSINISAAARRAEELTSRFGKNRVIHALVNTAPLLRRLLAENAALLKPARSPLVFDLACKMASVLALIRYAERNRITDISDGSAREQTQIFLQHPDFSRHIAQHIALRGLRLIPPVNFAMSRAEKIRRLETMGFRSGPAALEKLHITSQLRHQPFCMRGFITYFFTSPLRRLPPVKKHSLPIEKAKALWDAMWPGAQTMAAELWA